MIRPASLLALAAVATAAIAAAPTSAAMTPDGCVAGPPELAAHELVADHATVDAVGDVAGLTVATAVDPFVPPGIPNALLEVGGAWCTVDHFPAAAAAHLGGAPAVQVASAFASVAGMQYLGDVTVSDVAVNGTEVRLTTTGGRHGAVSNWTVRMAGTRVVAANFTTTGWTPGVAANAGSLEGITSLPGHTRSFVATPDGRIAIDATVADLMARVEAERPAAVAHAAEVAGLAPGDDLSHTFDDDFTIKVSYGMSPYTPDTGTDTGVKYADRLRTVLAGVVSSYADFYAWGVRDPFDNDSRTVGGSETGLPEAAGYINIDSPLTPVCLACSYLADAMEIHIALLFPEIAPVVAGVSYPDSEQFMVGVIGHEMVHSLQGGYSSAGGGVFGSAFIEGLARASESLHGNADNSYQRGSIHYVDSSNGCEGFENSRGGWINAQAAGPFNGHTYDACYFWWTYFAEHGPTALTTLLEAMPAAMASSQGDAATRNQRLLDLAYGDGALDLARWGAAAAAGSDADGYVIEAGDTGTFYDWFALLTPAPRARTLSGSQSADVADGGFRAFRAEAATTVTQVPAGAATYVFSIVDRQLVATPVTVGTPVGAGDIVVVVARGGEQVTGTLRTG